MGTLAGLRPNTKPLTEIDEMETQDRIIRNKERHKLTGCSRTTWERHEKMGNAPKSVPLLGITRGWRYSEIAAWVNDRKPDRQGGGA